MSRWTVYAPWSIRLDTDGEPYLRFVPRDPWRPMATAYPRTWTRRNYRAPQPRFTLARPTARPRPSSYARLVMHLRDTGQTGGVIQTPRGEMRWGDQCEPWVDSFEWRCCCGKEEPCPPGAPWPDKPCRPEAGDCCDGDAHTWQPSQSSMLPGRVDGNTPSDALYGDLTQCRGEGVVP